MTFVRVASRSELREGAPLCVEVHGARIALFRIGGEIHALQDRCTHLGGPLSEGFVEGEEVECPWHSARFNLKTGEALSPPAFESVRVYPVRVTGDEIEIETEGQPA